MADADSAALGTSEGPRTLAILLISFGAAMAAWLFSGPFWVLAGAWWPIRLLLLGIAITAASIAVVRRPRSTCGLAVAALVAFLAGGSIAEPIRDHTSEQSGGASKPGAFSFQSIPVVAAEGATFTAPLGTFADSLQPTGGPWVTATVNWGDGSESAAAVHREPALGYLVEGTHAYGEEGLYSIQVTFDAGLAAPLFPKMAAANTATTHAKVTRWDSARLLLRILAVVSAAASLLVMLPPVVFRIVFSYLILFHFSGILTAVTNIPPTAPWLSSMLWAHVYRPYLQFMYLNNAYHYYSPNPGPATLMWFRLDYGTKDGRKYWRWVKVPDFDERGTPIRADGRALRPYVEYTRRLSLAESINMDADTPPADFFARRARREQEGNRRRIPLHPEVIPTVQYRPPGALAQRWIASYVRHVARAYRHEEHPELPIVRVKVYRVIHNILEPGQFLAGIDPNDPALYWPFYQGEYDPEGRPIAGSLVDPFYGWLIPIVRQPKGGRLPPPGARGQGSWNPDDYDLKDYLKVQAGDMESPEGKP